MAVSTRQVKNKRNINGILTGRAGTVYDVNIKYTTSEGVKSTYAKKGFLTKKDALQHEAEMKTKLQAHFFNSRAISRQKQTVRDYLNEWLESYVKHNLRPATYENYKLLRRYGRDRRVLPRAGRTVLLILILIW